MQRKTFSSHSEQEIFQNLTHREQIDFLTCFKKNKQTYLGIKAARFVGCFFSLNK